MKYTKDIVFRGVELIQLWSKGDPYAVDGMTIAMMPPVVAGAKKGARSLAIQRWASSAARRAGSIMTAASPSVEDVEDDGGFSDASLPWGGGDEGQDLDADELDLFSSLLAGSAGDPVMESVMESVETCGIDVDDMSNKALAALFAMPMDTDFSSPGALADPAASLSVVAPILLALKDDDEGDCGEDDSALIQDAFEGYLQCSGINEILDPRDPVDAVSLSQDRRNIMELCTPLFDLVANMDMLSYQELSTLDGGDESDFEREGTRCLQSLLGDNPFGNIIRYEYDHLDKVLGCMGKLGEDLPHCVFSVPLEDGETLSLPLSLDKKFLCVVGSSSKILLDSICVQSYDGLDKCLPQIDDVDVDEYTSQCAQDEGIILGKQEFLGIDSSVLWGNNIPAFCSKVFEEKGLDTEELQSRLDYYNENREYGWTVETVSSEDKAVVEEHRSNPPDQDHSDSPEISHVESLQSPAKVGTFPFVAAGLIVSGGVLLLALIVGKYIFGRKAPQKNYAHVNVSVDIIDDREIA